MRGKRTEPFKMQRLRNDKTCETLIDFGYPVTIFAGKNLKNLLEVETLAVKVSQRERHVLGQKFLTIEVGRMLTSTPGSEFWSDIKVRRYSLKALGYQITPPLRANALRNKDILNNCHIKGMIHALTHL